MGYTIEDAEAIAARLRATLSTAQAQLTELLQAQASLSFAPPAAGKHVCRISHCRISRGSVELLEDHYRNVHGLEPSEVPS